MTPTNRQTTAPAVSAVYPDKASMEKGKILSLSPFFKIYYYGQAYQNPNHREKIVSGLRKAGLT